MPKKLSVHSTSHLCKNTYKDHETMKHFASFDSFIRLVGFLRHFQTREDSFKESRLPFVIAFRLLEFHPAQGLVEKGLPPVLVYFKDGRISVEGS